MDGNYQNYQMGSIPDQTVTPVMELQAELQARFENVDHQICELKGTISRLEPVREAYAVALGTLENYQNQPKQTVPTGRQVL